MEKHESTTTAVPVDDALLDTVFGGTFALSLPVITFVD